MSSQHGEDLGLDIHRVLDEADPELCEERALSVNELENFSQYQLQEKAISQRHIDM